MTDLVPAEFASSGMHIVCPSPGPTRRFQVLGERSSGTNLVSRLLTRNSDMIPSSDLGWKHGFPSALGIAPDLAVICMVRDPRSWVLSMHARPWHATPHLQGLPFSDFLRAPWQTKLDRPRYFEGAREAGIVGQPLQQDRDPLTGATFGDIMALRRAKLAGLLSYLRRDCPCVLLRLETVQADPEGTIRMVLDALGKPLADGPFRPVQKRLGTRFKPAIDNRPPTPGALSQADRAFVESRMDPALEGPLGYMTIPKSGDPPS